MNETEPQEWCTILYFPSDRISMVGLLCEYIKRVRDPSFNFEIRKPRGRWALIVYSRSQNQAQQRGGWLTTKTEELRGVEYHVTRKGALELYVEERPARGKSLVQLMKEGKLRKIEGKWTLIEE